MLPAMALEAKGRIFKIFETQQVTERFTKREFVLEVQDGKYPQTVLFQLTGDRCANLDPFREGQEVRVEFNLCGREWRSPKGDVRYFNSLDVWRMEPLQDDAGGAEDMPPPPEEYSDFDGDIPF